MISQLAEQLIGKCLVEVPAGEPFDYMTAHLSWGSKRVAGVLDNQSAMCGNKISLNPKFAGKTAYRYGPKPLVFSAVEEGPISDPYPEYKFSATELAAHGKSTVPMYPNFPFYTASIYGPRYKRNHVCVPLKKIKKNDLAMDGYPYVLWDNAVKDPKQPDLQDDWLGHLLPGVYTMASADFAKKPFFAHSNYETSGSELSAEWEQKSFIWTSWCNPLKVYTDPNTVVGTLVGTAFVVFFTPACLRDPRVLVNDPRSSDDPPPKLQSELQYWLIDLWTYWVCIPSTNSSLRSRRVATQRWWYFTQSGPGPNSETVSPKTPYWYLRCQLNPYAVKCRTLNDTAVTVLNPNAEGELAIVA